MESLFIKNKKHKPSWDVLTEREQDPYIDYVYYLIENKYIYGIEAQEKRYCLLQRRYIMRKMKTDYKVLGGDCRKTLKSIPEKKHSYLCYLTSLLWIEELQ